MVKILSEKKWKQIQTEISNLKRENNCLEDYLRRVQQGEISLAMIREMVLHHFDKGLTPTKIVVDSLRDHQIKNIVSMNLFQEGVPNTVTNFDGLKVEIDPNMTGWYLI